jgi:hypothetical protein
LSDIGDVPLHAKRFVCPMRTYGAAPGNTTPETSMPPPRSSISLKICGEK